MVEYLTTMLSKLDSLKGSREAILFVQSIIVSSVGGSEYINYDGKVAFANKAVDGSYSPEMQQEQYKEILSNIEIHFPELVKKAYSELSVKIYRCIAEEDLHVCRTLGDCILENYSDIKWYRKNKVPSRGEAVERVRVFLLEISARIDSLLKEIANEVRN